MTTSQIQLLDKCLSRASSPGATGCMKLLEDYIKVAISYERNLAFHVSNGTAVDTDGGLHNEDSIHDFLNETADFYDDEYEDLKNIFLNYWEENDIEISFDTSSPDYQCPIEFGKSNYRALGSLITDVHTLITYLAECQEHIVNAEEKGVLSEGESRDKFCNLLNSYGLDYSLYCELYEMEWDDHVGV